MTVWEIALRAIGLFYAVGGLIMLRALVAAGLIDAMLAALKGGATWRDRLRTAWLAAGGILTTVAGLALSALESSALVLMLVNAVTQSLWLAVAALLFPPEDDEDRLGRARTTRACLIYIAALGLVAWPILTGAVEVTTQPWLRGALAVFAVALAIWQAVVHWRGGLGRVPGTPEEDEPETAADETPLPRPVNLIVRPTLGAWPLWDEDDGRNLDPHRLGLPENLVARIVAFENAAIDAIDPDHDRDDAPAPDPLAIERLTAEAIALVAELEAEFGDGHVAWALPEQLGG